MPNITLSVSDKTKHRMEKHPEVRWSNAVRVVIERKLAEFELSEKLAHKSKLTEKDIEFLSSKVDKSMTLHAKRLLNEGHG